eukprot:14830251-Alexandrium_andersonii.AAC.1
MAPGSAFHHRAGDHRRGCPMGWAWGLLLHRACRARRKRKVGHSLLQEQIRPGRLPGSHPQARPA